MPIVTVIYGEKIIPVEVASDSLVGDAVAATGLPLEQPCAGRGTCGKCKILVEGGAAPPDAVEAHNLTPGELAVGNRLACRARVAGAMAVTLAPVVVYSDKIFRASSRYRQQRAAPLGLAIDLGSTTVAAFLTMLDNGEVCAGGAALNQQTVYGADLISRLAAARADPQHAERLHKLALASINTAIDTLNLSAAQRARIQRVVVVGNTGMHHLLLKLPIESLALIPFQPYSTAALAEAAPLLGGLFPAGVRVSFPPLIGGFVGSDALACLAYFDFDRPSGPMAAVDLGTNGEVMVTDGARILTASTAAGPAFEGVNISCGTRAVDGAIVDACLGEGQDGGALTLTTIGDGAPVGLTGSGLLHLVHALYQAGVIEPSGRFASPPPLLAGWVHSDERGVRRLALTGDGRLTLSQLDVRELQKAKGAIRAAIDSLLARLDLAPGDLSRLILTGSFGGRLRVETVLALGMVPPVPHEIVVSVANGAGLGAATFLGDAGFARAEALAAVAEQIDLDQDPNFNMNFVNAMAFG